MRPFGTHDVVFIIEDQEIEWLIRSVAGQIKMPGDAEILAKGVSVSLTGGMAAGSLNMVAQVLMAHFLDAADFGLYASLPWFASLLGRHATDEAPNLLTACWRR